MFIFLSERPIFYASLYTDIFDPVYTPFLKNFSTCAGENIFSKSRIYDKMKKTLEDENNEDKIYSRNN